MINLKDKELLYVEGGAINWGTMMNYAARLINSVLDLGRSLGSAIRRLTSGKVCKV